MKQYLLYWYYRDKSTSLAIWFPSKPDGLFIFSRIENVEGAIIYSNTIRENDNVKYEESKSYLFFDEKLYPLPIMTINNIKQPVYFFVVTEPMTRALIELDYFTGNFYNHTQPNGMTSIKFGLSGFTEALGAYNKYCK